MQYRGCLTVCVAVLLLLVACAPREQAVVAQEKDGTEGATEGGIADLPVFSRQALDELRTHGRTVVVVVWADWTLTVATPRALVRHARSIRYVLKKYEIAVLSADISEGWEHLDSLFDEAGLSDLSVGLMLFTSDRDEPRFVHAGKLHRDAIGALLDAELQAARAPVGKE